MDKPTKRTLYSIGYNDFRWTAGVPRYPGLTLRVLGADAPAMGPGRAQLISLIATTGSISAAAREMGMSYRRAWLLVAALNESFTQPVVVAGAGGPRGGGAQVTAFGKHLVAEYRAMEEAASAAIATGLRGFERHLHRPPHRAKRGR
jgi:molybdate transport system regulatory protein